MDAWFAFGVGNKNTHAESDPTLVSNEGTIASFYVAFCATATSVTGQNNQIFLVKPAHKSVGAAQRPVIQFERLHPLKLAGVVGHQNAAVGQRMAGNPQVVGPNRRARRS